MMVVLPGRKSFLSVAAAAAVRTVVILIAAVVAAVITVVIAVIVGVDRTVSIVARDRLSDVVRVVAVAVGQNDVAVFVHGRSIARRAFDGIGDRILVGDVGHNEQPGNQRGDPDARVAIDRSLIGASRLDRR